MDPRDFKSLCRAAYPVRGGFDSHTFPPRTLMVLLCLIIAGLMLAPNAAADDESVARNPAFAALMSATVPGLGQFYNGKEMKGTALFAIESAILAGIGLENRRASQALSKWHRSGETVDSYYDAYSDHFDRRQTLVWWAVLVGLYGVLDAYVDAHLSDFDKTLGVEHYVDPLAAGDESYGFRLVFRY